MASKNVCQVFVPKLAALYINFEVKVEFFTLEVHFVPSLSIQLLSYRDSYEKLTGSIVLMNDGHTGKPQGSLLFRKLKKGTSVSSWYTHIHTINKQTK